MMGWPRMMSGWGGYGLLGWLPALIFWMLLLVVIVGLLHSAGGGRTWRMGEEKTPLDILKERYAKGEITQKEYEEMKQELR